jgi:hypothetical protein
MIFQYDVGTVLNIAFNEDISSATAQSIIIKKPSGKKIEVIADRDGQTITYTVQEGDLDEIGIYEMQPKIEMEGWKGSGRIVTFTVNKVL